MEWDGSWANFIAGAGGGLLAGGVTILGQFVTARMAASAAKAAREADAEKVRSETIRGAVSAVNRCIAALAIHEQAMSAWHGGFDVQRTPGELDPKNRPPFDAVVLADALASLSTLEGIRLVSDPEEMAGIRDELTAYVTNTHASDTQALLEKLTIVVRRAYELEAKRKPAAI